MTKDMMIKWGESRGFKMNERYGHMYREAANGDTHRLKLGKLAFRIEKRYVVNVLGKNETKWSPIRTGYYKQWEIGSNNKITMVAK